MTQPPPPATRQLFSISQINNLPHEQMVQVYRKLLPSEILHQFDINPETLADDQGHSLFECRPAILHVKLALYHAWQAEDPVLYVQLPFSGILVLWYYTCCPLSVDWRKLPT